MKDRQRGSVQTMPEQAHDRTRRDDAAETPPDTRAPSSRRELLQLDEAPEQAAHARDGDRPI